MSDTTDIASPTNMTTTSPNDKSCPSIIIIHSSTPYTREKLSKAKGNYHQYMLIHLMGNCFFDYIEGDTNLGPCAHRNWLSNDCQAWPIIAGSINPNEWAYIKLKGSGTTMAKAAWITLKAQHENEGPIHQVNLLQKALATKCTRDVPLPETGCQICKDIKWAFTIGTLNQDLLCCIALMNALEDFSHLCTTISTSLTNSKSGSYTSESILLLLIETEQALHEADMLKHTHNNQFTESTA